MMNRCPYLGVIVILSFLFLACENEESLFEKIDAGYSNIYFSNDFDPDSRLSILNYLYYYNGGGVAAGDYNSDGLIDLYFTSNEGADKLYINKGNFRFEDITSKAGINNSDGWTTGISNVDINGDGLLDLYISKVSQFQGLTGHNLLYVNRGNNDNNIPVFEEQSAKYGLNFSGFSTQSVFFDYDLDGDLDMFLLNHSVHPNTNYGKGQLRNSFDPKSGDRLFRNDDGHFNDVSKEAGIFQGKIGYGLGISVGDLNGDFYPDVYIGNDFFENDYLYINNGNGGFDEIISNEPEKLGHTTHFSMGNDISDMNNDGRPDILSLDMLPEDLETYKTSGLEYPFQTYSYYLKNGYSPQYMQNTLHLNTGDLNFSETAFISGVAASEWSWGAMFADFDNDTHKDLFISNGIKGATNDMDFIKYISNEKIQEKLSRGEYNDYENLIKDLPEKRLENYIYKNLGDNTFRNLKNEWLDSGKTFSHGFVYADLDNDGDLDLAINNTESTAGIYRNNAEKVKDPNSFLKIDFKGSQANQFGIGAKVKVYNDGKMQFQEQYLTRGYLSSIAPGLNFGMGKSKVTDSVVVIWPNGFKETKHDIKTNTTVLFNIKDAKTSIKNSSGRSEGLVRVDSLINYRHVEQSTLDFNKEPLIPFGYSNLSPAVTVSDFNNDGLDDIVIGGGKTQALGIWTQNDDGTFTSFEASVFDDNAISEDTFQLFVDIENDGDKDLIVVSGGNEFKGGKALQPRLYINQNGTFQLVSDEFKGLEMNASKISAVDFNNDGFTDLCFTANIEPSQYGKTPIQYLLLNNGKGHFTEVTTNISKSFQNAGMVQDIVWKDINGDNYPDAIMAGHWMPLKVFLNNNGESLKLVDAGLEDSNGWWNAVVAEDFDADGDIDIVAGNWGLNSRLSANKDQPIKLYLTDFDDNGSIDPVMTYFYNGTETPFSSKDELDKQMPFLKKKYPNYSDYAKASFSDIFPEEKLKKAQLNKVYELGSYYFENLGNNTFKKHLLPFEAQVSKIFDIEEFDFNNDGYPDLFIVGNDYEISTQLGRLDASHGAVLINDTKGNFKTSGEFRPNLSGPARDIEKFCINGRTHFIVTFNNAEPVILKYNNIQNP
ncbi:VCBS repeat-containing protein [Gramella jeungdoensis]|uniref:VCBS repeat-containing protein n=1 Tax=Gramella jeungdoensis TaxID=708091 RepID=A0ABT0Z4U9_9FLAO|nr:VCBS repeat-containing protein [Gramella jeungdoensis]MCM8570743.1 VCBS repeat-containing protein [Gramella jeungdoensis]